MSSEFPRIDRAKLRSVIRKLDGEYVFAMLYEALELLPGHELGILAAGFQLAESISSVASGVARDR